MSIHGRLINKKKYEVLIIKVFDKRLLKSVKNHKAA